MTGALLRSLASSAADVLELVEDRYGTKSLLMSSQLPVDQWFDVIGDATIADTIMDRGQCRPTRTVCEVYAEFDFKTLPVDATRKNEDRMG